MLTGRLPFQVLFFQVFIFVSTLSYVSFRANDYDTQIWHIPFAAIIVLSNVNKKIVRTLIPEACLIGIASILLIISDLSFLPFRSWLSYVSFVLVYSATRLGVGRFGLQPIVAPVLVGALCYFTAGVIQEFYGKFTLDWLVKVRTTEGRGVTGLAAEPSYFATIMLFMIGVAYVINRRCSFRWSFKTISVLGIISIVFLARSPLGLLYLSIGAAAILGSRPSLKLALLAAFFTAVIAVYGLKGDTRLTNVTQYAAGSGVISLVLNDASINQRTAGVVVPWLLSTENLYWPGGFDTYKDASERYTGWASSVFFYSAFGVERIPSFVGNFVYELGFFGLFYLAVVGWRIYRAQKPYGNILALVVIGVLFLFLASAVPVAMPMAAIMVAVLSVPARPLVGRK